MECLNSIQSPVVACSGIGARSTLHEITCGDMKLGISTAVFNITPSHLAFE